MYKISSHKGKRLPNYGHECLPSISPHEHQVMQLLMEGLTQKQIAKKLNVSYSGVNNCIYRLLTRTGSHTKCQLVAKYLLLDLKT